MQWLLIPPKKYAETEQLVNSVATVEKSAAIRPEDIFDNLENAKSNQSNMKVAVAKKRLLKVPVKTPGNQEWIRVHPSPEYRLPVWLFIYKSEEDSIRGTTYYVTNEVAEQLQGTTIKGTGSCDVDACHKQAQCSVSMAIEDSDWVC
jgi:hypothetical protein